MLDMKERHFTGVHFINPEMTLIASFKGMSSSFAWVPCIHTGAQYSAGATTNARVETLNALKLASQLVLASFFASAVRAEILFLRVESAYDR